MATKQRGASGGREAAERVARVREREMNHASCTCFWDQAHVEPAHTEQKRIRPWGKKNGWLHFVQDVCTMKSTELQKPDDSLSTEGKRKKSQNGCKSELQWACCKKDKVHAEDVKSVLRSYAPAWSFVAAECSGISRLL